MSISWVLYALQIIPDMKYTRPHYYFWYLRAFSDFVFSCKIWQAKHMIKYKKWLFSIKSLHIIQLECFLDSGLCSCTVFLNWCFLQLENKHTKKHYERNHLRENLVVSSNIMRSGGNHPPKLSDAKTVGFNA